MTGNLSHPTRLPVPQLPFVVAPKRETRLVEAEVNGQICSLEFPVFGALRAGELIDIREHEYQSAVYRESSRLADALVADGTDELEAQRIAIRIISTRMGVPVALDAAEQRIVLRHADLISSLQDSLNTEYTYLLLRTVTALISRRLRGCEAWTTDDTETLPSPLQTAIAAFADSEKGGSAKTPEQQVKEMTETLGKLAAPASPDAPETTPGSSSPRQPTGPHSSGDAANSGPTPQSSTATTSPASPSPTSSKRSRKASAT